MYLGVDLNEDYYVKGLTTAVRDILVSLQAGFDSVDKGKRSRLKGGLLSLES